MMFRKKVRDFDQWGAPDKKGGVVGTGVRREREGGRVAGGKGRLAGTASEQAIGKSLTNTSSQKGKIINQSLHNILTIGPAPKSRVGGGEKGGRLDTEGRKSLVGAELTTAPSTSLNLELKIVGGGRYN